MLKKNSLIISLSATLIMFALVPATDITSPANAQRTSTQARRAPTSLQTYQDARATNASAEALAETAPAVQPQLPRPWTALASTGAVDETSIPHFISGIGSGGTPTAFGFSPASGSLRLQARYNVTNTYDNNANPNLPGWTTLELGAEAPGTSTVMAFLYRIERCSATVTTLCSVTVTNQAAPGCRTCTFAPGSVDFTQFLYLVDVRVIRPNAQTRPYAHTLRIY
jgi:hypothetical protein